MAQHLSRIVLGALAAVLLAAPALAAPPKIGDVPPPIGIEKLLQAPEKAAASWETLRGKVVILEFWGTWCVPCWPAMDHLSELTAHFAGRPFQVIAVTDEGEEPVKKFLDLKPSRLWIGLDTDGSMFDAFDVGPVPHTVIVDPKGKIAAITHPDFVTAAAIEDLIAGKAVSLPVASGRTPPAPAAPAKPPGS